MTDEEALIQLIKHGLAYYQPEREYPQIGTFIVTLPFTPDLKQAVADHKTSVDAMMKTYFKTKGNQ